MKRQQAFREVFTAAFNESRQWTDWFFSNVAVKEEEIYVSVDGQGKPAGALLMQPFDFMYQGTTLRSEYMSCVGTKPEARAHGVASKLITQALVEAAERGSAFCELIPAQDHLYFFYRRFGFSGVFYVDRQRYTALHSFASYGVPVEPTYELFSELERRTGCGVLHSREQYLYIIGDIAVDGGYVFAVRDDAGAAILFASEADGYIKVKSLLADSEALAEGVLARLREAVGEMAIVVDTPPVSEDKAYLRSYGMVRILDVRAVLSVLAAAHPELKYNIRVHDTLISDNNGAFALGNGKCVSADDSSRKPDLDVHIDILAAILFSNRHTASVFDLPGGRPYMTLMLD